jgi:hypothetical protein
LAPPGHVPGSGFLLNVTWWQFTAASRAPILEQSPSKPIAG